MSRYRNLNTGKLYKNSRRGKICGVFSGLGDYLGINPMILRVLGILAILISGPIVVAGYLLVSILLDDNSHSLHDR